jgi:hypothetical protein
VAISRHAKESGWAQSHPIRVIEEGLVPVDGADPNAKDLAGRSQEPRATVEVTIGAFRVPDRSLEPPAVLCGHVDPRLDPGQRPREASNREGPAAPLSGWLRLLRAKLRQRRGKLVVQRARGLSGPDLSQAVPEELLRRRFRGAAAHEERQREARYDNRRTDATIISPVSASPEPEVGQAEQAEVVGALIAVRRFAGEMSEAYADFGRAEQQEDAGARAMIDACDCALDELR